MGGDNLVSTEAVRISFDFQVLFPRVTRATLCSMTKPLSPRTKPLGLAVAMVVLATTLFLCWSNREPSYEGKPLSYWLSHVEYRWVGLQTSKGVVATLDWDPPTVTEASNWNSLNIHDRALARIAYGRSVRQPIDTNLSSPQTPRPPLRPCGNR